ncbi:MAG TPA: 3-dehydroquinate synthase [Thermomicrobiales bacterium]|nr:3-dehydroquinate synthase [Thermomicrobiales bacterium]
MSVERIVLAGLSGTGKSTVARRLAELLGWDALDTDTAIETEAGRRIPEIFATEGEGAFRLTERQILRNQLDRSSVVIATGGGATVAEDAWTEDVLHRPGTMVVALDGEPQTLLRRLQEQQSLAGETIERPLLAGDDPELRLRTMQANRQEAYDRADVSIVTDTHTSDQVASTIAALLPQAVDTPLLTLRTAAATSDIYVAQGVSTRLGTIARERFPKARRAWVITDANVGPLHSPVILTNLQEAGIVGTVITVSSGESSKSWAVAGEVVDQVLLEGLQRNDLIIALGGGVVGDLAGFVAAIALRGVGLIQVPTSLLAMVDSSVGGKTGINHVAGKNLIGAFYQPPIVLIDPALLETLPSRELTQSWAEMAKHAIIQPSAPDPNGTDLLRTTERNRRAASNEHGPAITHLIRRNVTLKASVVEADEREASLRAILNYGHTIGHAIEASEYRYLHGEAIAVGMRAANVIATEVGLLDIAEAARLNAFITSLGLPDQAVFDPDRVREKMLSDKKHIAGTQTWVLPVSKGGVTLHTGVSDATIDGAIAVVCADATPI